MFSRLRSRLWVSYFIIVIVVLIIVGVGIAYSIQRNELLVRNTGIRLRLIGVELRPFLLEQLRQNPDQVNPNLKTLAEKQQYRLVLLTADGKIIADSGEGNAPTIPTITPSLNLPSDDDPIGISSFVDRKETTWLYITVFLKPDTYLLVIAVRPPLNLRTLLRDGIATPIIQAAIVAIFLAFLMGLAITRWISYPVQRMALIAHHYKTGENITIPEEGPKEIQELAHAFNTMMLRVQSSQQSQKDFIANVSHELKTPLTSIQGFAQAIMDGTVQAPMEIQKSAGVIYDESEKMSRLVMDLLSLSRLESGIAGLLRTQVDLVIIIQDVCEKFRIHADQTQIEIRDEISTIPMIIGDADRLSQVFSILIDNALKFTPQGGYISLRSEIIPEFVIIHVIDSGPGINIADQDRIFERFYQADKSRQGGSKKGVGLGLPIARQIVLLHGGNIWVESSQGSGSDFVVKLPVSLPDDVISNTKKVVS